MANETFNSSLFVGELTKNQPALYSYISVLLGDTETAKDVLQNVNVALWKKAAEYDSAKPFLAWAKSFAYFEVKAYRQRKARDSGRVVFDETLFEEVSSKLAEEDQREDGKKTGQLRALEHCLRLLGEGERRLVLARYAQNVPPASLARQYGGTPNSMAAKLYRIRKELAACILKKMCRIRKGEDDGQSR